MGPIPQSGLVRSRQPFGVSQTPALLALRKLHGQKFVKTFAKSLLLFLAVALAEMILVGASVWTAIQRH